MQADYGVTRLDRIGITDPGAVPGGSTNFSTSPDSGDVRGAEIGSTCVVKVSVGARHGTTDIGPMFVNANDNNAQVAVAA